MTHSIGQPPVAINLRRLPRARRFSLRVGQLDGVVTLTLPPRAREGDALDFARAHEEWIRAALARRPPVLHLAYGGQVMVQGEWRSIVPALGRRVELMAGTLAVPKGAASDDARVGARIAAFLKLRARDHLAGAVDDYAAKLGRGVAQISLRDTRTRWGSCTADGRLMFNWRLIMAPPDVLHYVAAHEVAHLAEMNHSAAFWAVVARLCPDWQAQRGWLKQNGGALQSVQFTPRDGA